MPQKGNSVGKHISPANYGLVCPPWRRNSCLLADTDSVSVNISAMMEHFVIQGLTVIHMLHCLSSGTGSVAWMAPPERKPNKNSPFEERIILIEMPACGKLDKVTEVASCLSVPPALLNRNGATRARAGLWSQ